jgi:syntaxin 7
MIKQAGAEIRSLGQDRTDADTSLSRKKKLEQQKLQKDFTTIQQHFARVEKDVLVRVRDATEHKSGHDTLDIEEGEETVLLQDHHHQVQHQVQHNDQLIEEREGEILEIHQGVTQINEIFRDLGTIVNEQQTLFDHVEQNVVGAATDIRKGTDDVSAASRYQRASRKMMCYVLLILAFILAVLVLLVMV